MEQRRTRRRRDAALARIRGRARDGRPLRHRPVRRAHDDADPGRAHGRPVRRATLGARRPCRDRGRQRGLAGHSGGGARLCRARSRRSRHGDRVRVRQRLRPCARRLALPAGGVRERVRARAGHRARRRPGHRWVPRALRDCDRRRCAVVRHARGRAAAPARRQRRGFCDRRPRSGDPVRDGVQRRRSGSPGRARRGGRLRQRPRLVRDRRRHAARRLDVLAARRRENQLRRRGDPRCARVACDSAVCSKAMISFGVTVLPDPPWTCWLDLIQLAESHGFEYAWTYDSHVLWQESIPTLAVAARETSKIKLGHFVTNPATRDPTVLASSYATLHDLSDGRMVMGVGRGDSAVRYIGRQPMKVADFEVALAMIHEFMNGREVTWNDKRLQLKWVRPELPPISMWVAGYGPKALGVAGRVGDGVIIQLADPEIITWIMDTARRAAEEAGRDPSQLKCIVGAPSHVTDDLADARDQVRWFPAMVSNHVMDLIERYGGDGSSVPKALTDYVQARKFYDYNEHSRVGAKHGEFVTDEICDRFCVLGTTNQIKAKLKELDDVGVDQFNIYLMTHGQEETLQAYGGDIIPEFAGVAA